jgi:hypothetical protein
LNNKLFIIEGLPCTGKSTTAKYIADILLEQGNSVLHYDEGTSEHPADYEFHAYMTESDLNILSDGQLEYLKNVGVKKNLGLLIALSKVGKELFDKIIPFKIYDCLPWEKEKTIMLSHWQEFAQQALLEKNTYVFNCCFLQNPLCEMMMRFNFPYYDIQEYIMKIYDHIKDLNPVVIYLENSHVKERVSEIALERDNDWLKSVIDYHTSQGYGKENNLSGFDGYVDCLEKRQQIELKILNSLPIKKVIIKNPYENWDNAHGIISNFIS